MPSAGTLVVLKQFSLVHCGNGSRIKPKFGFDSSRQLLSKPCENIHLFGLARFDKRAKLLEIGMTAQWESRIAASQRESPASSKSPRRFPPNTPPIAWSGDIDAWIFLQDFSPVSGVPGQPIQRVAALPVGLIHATARRLNDYR